VCLLTAACLLSDRPPLQLYSKERHHVTRCLYHWCQSSTSSRCALTLHVSSHDLRAINALKKAISPTNQLPLLCTVLQSYDTHDCDSNCPAMLAAPHWQLFCLLLCSNKKETKRHPRDCVPVATLQTIPPTRVPLCKTRCHFILCTEKCCDARELWQTHLLQASPTLSISMPQKAGPSCVGWLPALSNNWCCHRLLVSGRTGVFEGDILTGSMPAQVVHQLRKAGSKSRLFKPAPTDMHHRICLQYKQGMAAQTRLLRT